MRRGFGIKKTPSLKYFYVSIITWTDISNIPRHLLYSVAPMLNLREGERETYINIS